MLSINSSDKISVILSFVSSIAFVALKPKSINSDIRIGSIIVYLMSFLGVCIISPSSM